MNRNKLTINGVLLFMGMSLLISCGETLVNGQLQRWVIFNSRGQYGYMDVDGNQVVRSEFDYAVEFSEGMGGINIGGTANGNKMPTDGKWGFIDAFGNIVINPKYDSPPVSASPYDTEDLALSMHESYIYSEGLAPVRMGDRWVYIDQWDSVIIDRPEIKSPRRFSRGLAAVYTNKGWGFINHKGEYVIEPQYIFVENFKNKRTIAIDKNLRRVVLLDEGRVDSMLSIFRLETSFHEGIATVHKPFRGTSTENKNEWKYGLIDTTGKYLFDPHFDKIGRFGSGLAPVLVGSKPSSFMNSADFRQASVHRGGRWGFINKFGVYMMNPVYDDAKGYKEGIASVKRGGFWGYMNAEGGMITDFEFLWTGYFEDQLAKVRLGPQHNDYSGKFAYINRDGDVVWIEP